MHLAEIHLVLTTMWSPTSQPRHLLASTDKKVRFFVEENTPEKKGSSRHLGHQRIREVRWENGGWVGGRGETEETEETA